MEGRQIGADPDDFAIGLEIGRVGEARQRRGDAAAARQRGARSLADLYDGYAAQLGTFFSDTSAAKQTAANST